MKGDQMDEESEGGKGRWTKKPYQRFLLACLFLGSFHISQPVYKPTKSLRRTLTSEPPASPY